MTLVKEVTFTACENAAMPGPVFKRIDVRKLIAAGKEPFPLIRRAADALGEDEGLEIIAPFIPSPLVELMTSEGFEKSMEHAPDGSWITRFWRE